ncbi:MAG TPA: FG-GAP repeat protein, partial [Solirubrobacteraceae bacterium]|nr:FG-GAP repeat protein [Solirubrobacteraceae bacterium]
MLVQAERRDELVGAPGGDGGNGIVYSYRRQSGKYVLAGQITAPDGAYGDEFGVSVSLSGLGNVALISAPDHNGYEGAAYVFSELGSSQHTLVGDAAAQPYLSGLSVSLDA